VGMEAFAAAGEGIGSVYAAAKGMRTNPTPPANVTPSPSITSAPTTDGATGDAITLTANNGTVVVWGMNSAGTVSVYQGNTEPLDAAGNFTNAPQFPIVPDTICPFAYQVIKAGATTSGTWTFGSSNWNATGLSHSAKDLCTMPPRPVTS
ncbi:hypothetical protein K0U83_17665, partial [bacterium]|nr:hypothetical protein [bacterium]